MSTHKAFTLVEMLLVVATISLLVALLLPALVKSRYYARLAVCANNLKQIATGANTYALDNQSYYPRRISNTNGTAKPGNLWYGSTGFDDRPLISRYMAINAIFNDPLTGTVNMENVFPSTTIEAPYHLWFGYKYAGERGLLRPTSKLTWQGNSFNIVASDRDVVNWGGGTWVHGSHPDGSNVMYDEVLQMASDTHFSGGQYVFSRWQSHSTFRRGLLDLNFARTDGSVFMVANLIARDPRLIPVPEFANGGNWPTAPTYLPAP